MKQFFTFFAALVLPLATLAQNTFAIKGRVTDRLSGETLPGATIKVTGNGQDTGDGADAEGNYKIGNLPPGTYTVQASFVGYKPLSQQVKVSAQNVTASFALAPDNASLEEVTVVATLAQERQTPVAFAAVNEVKLRETLSNRDLPLILNETPGVYATQAGGGTGDSRINVRGFDQRNVAVLVNGVPVNDMENGQVYWSNWDLADVTKSLQVQRGLSASKIAVPSVGGTINLLTRGFDDKQGAIARVEGGSNNYRKYSLMLSSGNLPGDWSFTFFGSRRSQDGWVDKTFDDAWTYFGNVSKRLGSHRLSLTALGSPQRHGQRTFASPVGVYSNEKARELGANVVPGGDLGFRYNPNWGVLNRYTVDPASGQRAYQGEEVVNERINYYHKPQINLNDFWQVSDKLFLSAVLYASFGNGGGSGGGGIASNTLPTLSSTRQIDFQKVYDTNYGNVQADGSRLSTQWLRNAVNNHRWYGFVLGGDYNVNERVTVSAGVDGRSYYGEHYQEIRDLLGGDYVAYLGTNATRAGDKNSDPATRLGSGDKIGYNYNGKTQWLGGYAQAEYKTPVFSAVLSATASEIRYKRIDYFKKRDADNAVAETDWAAYTGYSAKAGANYNLTERNNLFVNVGYNRRVPFFNYVFTNSNTKFPDVRTEGITSVEVGYGISYPSLKATLNAYFTNWTNKTTTFTSTSTGVLVYNNVRNIDARHMGVELAVAQDVSRRLQLNAAISVGDWRWVGQGVLTQTDENNNPVGTPDQTVYLDGVHVGDAAQNQFQLGLRYEPFKGFYVRPSFLLFTKYYADFNPELLTQEANRTDSFRVPTSRNLDVHFGYDLPGKLIADKVRLGFRASVLNALNEFYITDVPYRAGVSYTNPGAIETFFNRGRIFTAGLSATL